MAFLKDELKKQKLLEAQVDIDKFIEEKKITDMAMIYEVAFDKSVFKTQAEAQEWLDGKWFYNYKIVEMANEFIATTLSAAQLDMKTSMTLELRRGVVVKAADLKPIMNTDIVFSSFDLSSKENTINLNEGLPQIIEVCRVAKGHHAVYGELEITREHIESFERNFNDKVTGVDLAVNEDHKKEGAFGWFKEVFRSIDGDKLYAVISWNAKGITALSDKLYRYFSPEFRFNYTHPLNGQEFGPTLMGGALTNYPFLKMDAITELNQKPKEGEEMTDKTISLSEHNSKVLELSNKVTSLTEDNAKVTKVAEGLKNENVELSNKNAALEKEISEMKKAKEKADKEAVHQKLFDEQKINKAQLVALNEGKTMLEVLALSKELNTDGKGNDNVNTDVELSEGDKEVIRKLGLTKEQFLKYNANK